MSEPEAARPAREDLAAAIEALIFVSDEPVLPKEIGAALGGVDGREIDRAIGELEARYERQGGGLRVERVAGGLRLATRPEMGEWVRRLIRQRNRTRLSPASLETLAIIAYRQPVTAPEIQAIRGKDPSSALNSLLDKKLLRTLGRKKVIGNPLLYGTTKEFLIHFGLDRLDDLPSIEEFDQFLGVLEGAQERLELVAGHDPREGEPEPPDAEQGAGGGKPASAGPAPGDGETVPRRPRSTPAAEDAEGGPQAES